MKIQICILTLLTAFSLTAKAEGGLFRCDNVNGNEDLIIRVNLEDGLASYWDGDTTHKMKQYAADVEESGRRGETVYKFSGKDRFGKWGVQFKLNAQKAVLIEDGESTGEYADCYESED